MISKNAMLLGVGIATSAIAVGGAAILVKVPFAWPGAQTAPAVASYRESSPLTSAALLPAAKLAATPLPALQSALANTPAPTASPIQNRPAALRPAFDVVRVERSGDAVIAGHAAPNAAIELRSDGQVVAKANADASGEFVVLPPPLSAGGHHLELAARSAEAAPVMSDAVTVSVPESVAIAKTAAALAPATASPSPKLESSPLANPSPATGNSLSMLEPEPAPISDSRPVRPARAPHILRRSIRTGGAVHYPGLSPLGRMAAATPEPSPIVEPPRLHGGGHR